MIPIAIRIPGIPGIPGIPKIPKIPGIPRIPLRGGFSWCINYWALWELAASGIAILAALVLYWAYQDTSLFILAAFAGYIAAKIGIWLTRGGFR